MKNLSENKINKEALLAVTRRLDLYEQGETTLSQLAQDTYSIIAGMVEVPTVWHNRFMRYWGAIEEVNALALMEDSTDSLPEHKALLSKTLSDIRLLIDESL
ncbi:MAG: hypothetical protein HC800_19585 [Phormidesmis sp. RL_2_1]|nr:hypothetical protein [Phormidesmis sp. RL_2_1]